MKKLLAVLFALFLFPSVSMAETECLSDADCPEGYSCLMVTCACPGCAEGEECPPCDCGEGGFCAESGVDDGGYVDDIYFETECETDADCPLDFKCESMELPCAMPDCPPCACAECDPDDPTCDPTCECPECDFSDYECTNEAVQVCTYSPLECEADADCPAGFLCEIYAMGGSAGSGTTTCDCPDCADPDQCGECTCEEEEVIYEEVEEETFGICVPEPTPCSTNEDCLEGWECAAMPGDCVCSAIACAPCEEGQECPECSTESTCECDEGENLCVPAGWDEVAQAVAEDWSASGEGSYTSEDSLLPVKAEGEDLVRQEATDGTNTDGTNGDLDTAAEEGGSSTGCTVGSNGAGSAGLFLMMALAGLLLLVVRRETVRSR